MTITPELDRAIRDRLADAYRSGSRLVDLEATDDDAEVWTIAQGSPADEEAGIEVRMLPYIANELGEPPGQTNLPLTLARSLLVDAGASIDVLGYVTRVESAAVRFATMAPIARSCTERAATAAWVIGGSDRLQRLSRALIVELRGVESLLRYLPTVRRTRDTEDLHTVRQRLLAIAESECGGYRLDNADRVLEVGEERRLSWSALVSAVTTPYAYAELSVHTHPTGHLHAASAEWFGGGHRQASFMPKSTLHDEGRICEPAVLAYARALTDVAIYIGTATSAPQKWGGRVVGLWREWCLANGCA